MQKIYFLLALLIGLGSCSTGLHIEKRHYRKGFYCTGTMPYETGNGVGAPERKTNATTVAAEPAAEKTVVANVETSIGDSSAAAAPQPLPAPVVADRMLEKSNAANDTVTTTVADSSGANTPQRSAPVPDEARGLNTMWWIALGLLVLGTAAAIVAFLPALSAGFAVIIGAAPFLIVGALVLSISVMVLAKRRMQSAGSAELRSYYERLRKRAKIVALLTASAILVFLLFLLLVIIALSNFQ